MKLFADGADLRIIEKQLKDPRIQGFTLNTTLMRKAGVRNYRAFVRELLATVPAPLPVSLPVIAYEHPLMYKQALALSGLGSNVYVKVPVVDLEGNPMSKVIGELSREAVAVNVTGIMTYDQAMDVLANLEFGATGILSVFAGRIANTGRDPVPVMQRIVGQLNASGSLYTGVDLLWASVREPLNVIQAEDAGCDIITLPKEILDKLSMFGRDLDDLSRETVKGFYEDGIQVGYQV